MRVLLIGILSLSVSGCIITTRPGHKRRAVKSCHPSEYWDGHRCRHKGKKKGHKKHKKAKKNKHDHRGHEHEHEHKHYQLQY